NARGLARALRAESIALVHAHGSHAARVATAAAAWAQVPVVLRSVYQLRPPGAGSGLDENLALRATQHVLCVCDAVRRSHAVQWGWAADRFVTVAGGVSP